MFCFCTDSIDQSKLSHSTKPKAPCVKGAPANSIIKRPPCVKGAPAERVRDCNAFILQDLQVGRMLGQFLRHDRYAWACHLFLPGGG